MNTGLCIKVVYYTLYTKVKLDRPLILMTVCNVHTWIAHVRLFLALCIYNELCYNDHTNTYLILSDRRYHFFSERICIVLYGNYVHTSYNSILALINPLESRA